MFRPAAISILLNAFVASTALASTISISTQSLGVSHNTPNDLVSCSVRTEALSASCHSNDGILRDDELIHANGYAFASAKEGVMRLGTSANASSYVGIGFTSPFAMASMTETFEVFGDVSFGLAYSGYWDLKGLPDGHGHTSRGVGRALFQIITPFDVAVFDLTAPDANLDDEMKLTHFYDRPTTIQVSWNASLRMMDAKGFMDFGHTGFLFTEADEHSYIKPLNPEFLSNQVYGSVPQVSLTASLGFTLSGLALLGALRRRRVL